MIGFWLIVFLFMLMSACIGFYVGALFEKNRLKTERLDDEKTRAYHLGKESPAHVEKGCNAIGTKPKEAQSSDVVAKMKKQDKKYGRLKASIKE